MNPLLEQFLQEARENLGFIDQNIEKIGGNDPELLNAVFRAAHTLKGGSGIVGFEGVKEITHHAEDLLDMLRSGKIAFEEGMIESLYNAFDEVMNLIEAAEESGEIVDADSVTMAAIVAELSAHMGKSEEPEAWHAPFAFAGADEVVNVPLPFLESLAEPLPFALGDFDEADCQAMQLYGILFDIDEASMVYGNDPLYTLSLLGDAFLGSYACMSEASAKAVLSGLDDPDGLNLHLRLIAYVRAPYETIEEALFNFIDELQFAPLDVAALLQVSRGEAGHAMEPLKELETAAAVLIAAKDREGLAREVATALQLVGAETLQHAQLERLLELLGVIADDDLAQLGAFFRCVTGGRPYRYDPHAPFPEARETAAAPAPAEVDAELLPQAREILEQQWEALQCCDGDAVFARVAAIVSRLGGCYPDMPGAFASAPELKAWLASELGHDAAAAEEAPVRVAATQPPVREPLIEAAPAETAAAETPEAAEPPKETAKKSVIGKTVKIEQESVDNLMNIVGELLVAKNSLPYLAESVGTMHPEMIRRAIMEKYTFINRLAEQLQDLIMSMRMLPISYVFDRYPKLVRDISKNLGKRVRLTMEGGETKLDKNMIEMLADPMIHIMRNSLDHGIEAPELREQKGKPAEGLISLKAYAQSDKIVIEIQDDGAGINVERVVNKVLEKGLLSIEKIDALSDDEKAELVMLPGLSTAETISEYSGRGVGMDVVKKSIENFGGTIRIKTVPNRGTTIILSIPVSLAVTSLLHVAMNGVHYGFPMDSVSETVKIDREEIEYLHNEPFVYIRGEVIPLLFITSMLDETALEGKQLPVVVLNIKGNLLAVVVNELLGQLDVVQKPFEGVMESHPIFSGTALLGNGQIIMAIDPLGVLGIAHVLKQDAQQAG